MKTKICNGCRKDLPVESFYKSNSHKDELQAKCKNCFTEYFTSEERREANRIYQKEYRKANGNYSYYNKETGERKFPESNPKELGTCTVCKETFTFEEGFHKNRNTKSGYNVKCKSCKTLEIRNPETLKKKSEYDKIRYYEDKIKRSSKKVAKVK